MSEHVFPSRNVKIRKTRRCFGCNGVNNPGTTMTKWTSIYEGQFWSQYICSTCSQIVDLAREDYDDGFEEFFTLNMMEAGETPDKVLERLIVERDDKRNEKEKRPN
jgi:hypothetical protein